MVGAFLVFLFVFAVVGIAIGIGFLYEENQKKEQLRRVLKTVDRAVARGATTLLMQPEQKRDLAAKLFSGLPVLVSMERLVRQANLKWSPGQLPILMMTACLFGVGLGAYLVRAMPAVGAGVLGGIGAAAPLLYVMRQRSKLIGAFEDQLPEALDFLARSLRAGHGFAIGLELLATDSPEPLASAFRRVANELQLGSSLESALGRLMDGVPLVDLRFFVSSVLLQQETGGNLSEILTKLSHIIRERFRLRGQVKAMSAHGRITGMILLFMPIVVALILFISSPEYLFVLTREKEGRYMLWGALTGQILAYFTIRKIVTIRV